MLLMVFGSWFIDHSAWFITKGPGLFSCLTFAGLLIFHYSLLLFHFYHSVLKLLTGLAKAAVTAFIPVVSSATSKATAPAKAKTLQPMFTR